MDRMEQLMAAFDRADKKYRETGEAKYREDAREFAAAIAAEQRAMETAEEQEYQSREDDLAQRRREVGEGQNLRIGPFDTGIGMPQEVTEFLAGAGRRLTDIGTLGNRESAPQADELLDDSGYATAGGVTADMAALSALGTLATPYRGAKAVQAARAAQASRGASTAGRIGTGPLQGSARATADAGRITGQTAPRLSGAGQARLAAPGGQVTRAGGASSAAAGGGAAPGVLEGVYTSTTATAPIRGAASLADKARGAVGAVANPRSLKGAVGGGAAYGAATSDDRAQGALFGAAGGGIGYGAAAGLGAAVSPRLAPGARELLDDGVPLTPGKMLGGKVQTLEDAATSVPLAGSPAASRTQEALESLNKKYVNDVLDVIGDRLDGHIKPGNEAIEVAQKKISLGYDDLFEGVEALDVDSLFQRKAASIRAKADRLGKTPRKTFKRIFEDMEDILSPGRISGRDFKRAMSRVRSAERALTRVDNPDASDLKMYLRDLHSELRAMFRRQNGEQEALRLDALDMAYAKMKRVEEAANYRGAKDGIFTPYMLKSVVRNNTPKKDYAAGRGFDQKAIGEVEAMFTPKVGDSGTAGRLMTGLGVLGAGYIEPGTLAGAGALAGAYTRPSQRVIRSALANRPPGANDLRGLLDFVSQYTGRAGVARGVNE